MGGGEPAAGRIIPPGRNLFSRRQVGWPGEPFVQPQLALKAKSPMPYLFCAHMVKGGAGYQPDAGAIRRGGYETWVANTSCLAGDTGERALAATRRLLAELWGE